MRAVAFDAQTKPKSLLSAVATVRSLVRFGLNLELYSLEQSRIIAFHAFHAFHGSCGYSSGTWYQLDEIFWSDSSWIVWTKKDLGPSHLKWFVTRPGLFSHDCCG
eukprot:s3567_g7.t1